MLVGQGCAGRSTGGCLVRLVSGDELHDAWCYAAVAEHGDHGVAKCVRSDVFGQPALVGEFEGGLEHIVAQGRCVLDC
jgi:hypothetical protein